MQQPNQNNPPAQQPPADPSFDARMNANPLLQSPNTNMVPAQYNNPPAQQSTSQVPAAVPPSQPPSTPQTNTGVPPNDPKTELKFKDINELIATLDAENQRLEAAKAGSKENFTKDQVGQLIGQALKERDDALKQTIEDFKTQINTLKTEVSEKQSLVANQPNPNGQQPPSQQSSEVNGGWLNDGTLTEAEKTSMFFKHVNL